MGKHTAWVGIAIGVLALACGGGAPTRALPDDLPDWACSDCKLYDVEVDGGAAFVANNGKGLLVLDVRGPTPKLVSELAGGSPLAVKVVGNTVYLGDFSSGLRAIDVTNPAAPVELSATACSSASPYYVETLPGGQLLACGNVWDVTNPSAPAKLASIPVGGSSMDVVVDGNIGWFATGTEGIAAVDFTDPKAPVALGTAPGPYTKDIVIAKGRAYVPDNNASQLIVYDVTNSAAPTQVGTVDLGVAGTGIDLAGDQLVVAAGRKGLLVFDTADPNAPKLVKTLGEGSPHDSYKVYVSGGKAYGADKESGLLIADL